MESETMIRAYLDTIENACRKKTLQDVERLLRQLNRELPKGLVATQQELESWLAHRRPELPPAGWKPWVGSTKSTYYSLLKPFYEWLSDPDDPWIDQNPFRKVRRPARPPGLPRPAPLAEARWAVTQAAKPFRMHCVLARFAGLRACEIAVLDTDNITKTNILVLDGKGGKDAYLPTHARIWEMVKDLPAGPVTRRPDGSRATPEWVAHSTNLYLHEQGFSWTLHKLRHRYITDCHKRTGDLLKTQQLARHSSPASTAGYAQVESDELRDVLLGIGEELTIGED
jgi:integrase/recombinase XerC